MVIDTFEEELQGAYTKTYLCTRYVAQPEAYDRDFICHAVPLLIALFGEEK